MRRKFASRDKFLRALYWMRSRQTLSSKHDNGWLDSILDEWNSEVPLEESVHMRKLANSQHGESDPYEAR